MPRTRIDLGFDLDRLSVLDAEGTLDASLAPEVPDEDLRRLYRYMLLVRAYDERRLRLQRQGRIGTFAPTQGQEAAQLGSVYAIDSTDWVVPSFRETAVALWRGTRLEDDLLFCAGHEEGIRIPAEAHDLPICIPVGSQIPHAVGLAWGLKLQGSDRIVLCYFGDGATSEGDFHEALNFASLHQVPTVLFCQNNQWAISVPRKEQTRSRTLAQKALAYDIPALVVDGNDLLAVIVATREAVHRARQGRGPTLIEAVTYRLGVHTTADEPTLYRSEAEVEEWKRRDPLVRLRRYLQDQALVLPEEEEAWIGEIRERVDAAVSSFEKTAASIDPLAMFDHLYAELPPPLVAQRDEVRRRLPREVPQAGREQREEKPPRREERQPTEEPREDEERATELEEQRAPPHRREEETRRGEVETEPGREEEASSARNRQEQVGEHAPAAAKEETREERR